jgi:competence protein ComEA
VGLKSLGLVLVAVAAGGQSPPAAAPEGPGKDLVEVVCTVCHTLERVVAKHGTKAEWQDKVLEMLQEDPDITQPERDRIVEYLARSFPPKVNVNKVAAKDLVEALEISAQDADAIVHYRDANGIFKTLDDLEKVPGLDTKKLEGHRDRLEF